MKAIIDGATWTSPMGLPIDKQKPHAFTWLTLPDLPHPPEHFIQRAYELRERGRQGLEKDVILK